MVFVVYFHSEINIPTKNDNSKTVLDEEEPIGIIAEPKTENKRLNLSICENKIQIATDLESNEHDSRIHRLLTELDELKKKLWLQNRLVEYWKSIVLKYEPKHKDPDLSMVKPNAVRESFIT